MTFLFICLLFKFVCVQVLCAFLCVHVGCVWRAEIDTGYPSQLLITVYVYVCVCLSVCMYVCIYVLFIVFETGAFCVALPWNSLCRPD